MEASFVLPPFSLSQSLIPLELPKTPAAFYSKGLNFRSTFPSEHCFSFSLRK